MRDASAVRGALLSAGEPRVSCPLEVGVGRRGTRRVSFPQTARGPWSDRCRYACTRYPDCLDSSRDQEMLVWPRARPTRGIPAPVPFGGLTDTQWQTSGTGHAEAVHCDQLI